MACQVREEIVVEVLEPDRHRVDQHDAGNIVTPIGKETGRMHAVDRAAKT